MLALSFTLPTAAVNPPANADVEIGHKSATLVHLGNIAHQTSNQRLEFDPKSETFIGNWLKARGSSVRDQLVLSTKVFNPVGPGPNQRGLSRLHILRQIDASLGLSAPRQLISGRRQNKATTYGATLGLNGAGEVEAMSVAFHIESGNQAMRPRFPKVAVGRFRSLTRLWRFVRLVVRRSAVLP